MAAEKVLELSKYLNILSWITILFWDKCEKRNNQQELIMSETSLVF